MKDTGIVRSVDNLGRIVLPMELRRQLEINEKDPLEIFVDSNDIILRKHGIKCALCGESDTDRLLTYNGKTVCKECAAKLGRLAAGKIG
ncbi:MAG: AbrB/MazE/SpoVT family DNA-binding domain-containing protein [Ethanoligenens sp.]